METNNTCIIVLGTPGSGTSILAGCLKELGADPGKNIISPGSNNGKARFENTDIVLTHKILLRDLGCRQEMIGSLPINWEQSKAAEKAKQKIRSILKNNFSLEGLFVVSDPQICRFLPLWLKVLREMSIKPALVFNLRHPAENAQSLEAKDNLEFKKALLLWLSYYRDAFNASSDIPKVITTFDQLLADPVFTLKRISNSLSIEYPVTIQESLMDILTFIQPEMKHHHFNPSGIKDNSAIEHFSNLYEQVRLLNAEHTGQISDNIDQPKEISGSSPAEIIPSVMMSGSAKNIISKAQSVPQEKNDLISNQLFNDLLLLIGKQERDEYSHKIELERRLLNNTNAGNELYAQIYFPSDHKDVFIEKRSKKILLAPTEWQEISVPIHSTLLFRLNGLKIKPLNTKGIVHISGIRLTNPATGNDILMINTKDQFNDLSVQGGAFKLPGNDSLTLLVHSNDPEIIIPAYPDLPDCPIELRIWIKVQTDLEEMRKIWKNKQVSFDELSKEKESLKEDLASSKVEITKTIDSLNILASQKSGLEAELTHTKQTLHSRESEKAGLETELNQTKQTLYSRESEKAGLETELNQTKQTLYSRESEKAGLETELNQTKQTLYSRESEKAGLETELNQTKQTLYSRESEKAGLETELNQTKQTLYSRESEKAGLETELTALNDKLEHTRTLITSKEARCQILEADKTELIIKSDAQADELKKIKDELSASRADLAKKQEHIYDLNSNLSSLQNNCEELNNRARQNQKWMRQLENDLNALLDSKRWKIGNGFIRGIEILLLKKKTMGAPEHMQQIFDSYGSEQNTSINGFSTLRPHFNLNPNLSYDDLMRLLEQDITAFSKSVRWKTGHALIGLIEKLLLRGNPRLALDHIQDIFKEYKGITSNWAHVSPEMKNRWIRHIRSDFNDLLMSKRWQTGDRLVRFAEMVLFRKKHPMAVDHIRTLLINEYSRNFEDSKK